jgi:hypothetical protein
MSTSLETKVGVISTFLEKVRQSSLIVPLGGISHDYQFFNLEDPVVIEKFNNFHSEVVKRIVIPSELIDDFILDIQPIIGEIISQFKAETGCYSVTFKMPQGDYVDILDNGDIEIRITGRKP